METDDKEQIKKRYNTTKALIYRDRIIRDENELNKIREYIINNPEKLEIH